MIEFHFTNKAKKEFEKLDYGSRDRVIRKLTELKGHPNIQGILRSVYGIKNASYRMRIGSLQLLLLQRDSNKFIVNKIGHRQNFYNFNNNSFY